MSFKNKIFATLIENKTYPAMNAYELIKRNKQFAVECVQLAENLPDTKLGNHIRGQLIRCFTPVAANYSATRLSQSKTAFVPN